MRQKDKKIYIMETVGEDIAEAYHGSSRRGYSCQSRGGAKRGAPVNIDPDSTNTEPERIAEEVNEVTEVIKDLMSAEESY